MFKTVQTLYGCFLLFVLLLNSACEQENLVRGVTLPTTIYILKEDTESTRTPGDPGVDGTLPLPTQLYLFVASPQDNSGGSYIFFHHEVLNVDGWTQEGGIAGTNLTRYSRTFPVTIPPLDSDDIFAKGRAFAILSSQTLSQFSTYTSDQVVQNMTLDQVKQLQFDGMAAGNNSVNLRDVYGGSNEVEYYAFSPTTSIVCSHIASKVDVRWNMRDILTNYPDAKVLNFIVKDAPRYGYYFNETLSNATEVGRTQNAVTSGNDLYATGSSTAILSPGSNVYGRQDFYIFHPSGNTVNWSILIDDGQASSTKYQFTKSSTPNIFDGKEAAYYRIDVHIDGVTSGQVLSP